MIPDPILLELYIGSLTDPSMVGILRDWFEENGFVYSVEYIDAMVFPNDGRLQSAFAEAMGDTFKGCPICFQGTRCDSWNHPIDGIEYYAECRKYHWKSDRHNRINRERIGYLWNCKEWRWRDDEREPDRIAREREIALATGEAIRKHFSGVLK